MIIKSMSRKAPSFGQLMDYIDRGADHEAPSAFVRNLYALGHDRAEVLAQFQGNYAYLPQRKRGNALYHEVIVLEPQGHLGRDVVNRALHRLAAQYCVQRAPGQLAWGRAHHNTDFPHIHLMISANEARSDRRVRLSKAELAEIQRDLERWRGEHLPELNAQVVYGRDAQKRTPKQPVQEGEMVRRTGEPSQKQQVFEVVQTAMTQSQDRAALESKLLANGVSLYQRGKTWGVKTPDGRRYRLRTLGLADDFERLSERKADTKHHDSRAVDLRQTRLDKAARDEIDGFDRE